LASSGLHSNGYSLARRVFTEKDLKGDWGRQLLKPTKIYTLVVLQALKKIEIKAMAHITGGGFYDNIPRVIPEGLQVRIRRGSWPVPRLFKEIQKRGEIADKEMFRTLNMGIGLVAVVAGKEAEAAVKLFEKLGERAWIIGELVKGQHEVVIG